MASLAITFTDNGDGTATISTASGGGSAGQTVTTQSLGRLMNIAKGWVGQSIPLLKLT
jgi:hypothetical protein